MEKTKQRPGVMVYFHLTEPLRCLPREDFADLMWAVLDYAQYGVLPQFENPLLQMSWGYLQHAADVDKERYDMRVQRASKGASMRWHKEAMLNDAYDAKYNTNTQADTDTHTDTNADADADTQASASASTQTETDTDPKTPEEEQRAEVGPAAGEEPLATPPKMTNSVSWAKMQAASVGRRRGEALERWREEQLAEITRQNEALRAEARAKKAAQRSQR